MCVRVCLCAHRRRPILTTTTPPLTNKTTHTQNTNTPSRRTLIYLILTLNHIYPDYDFSLLRAHHFRKEEGLGGIEETIDAHLVEASKVGGWVPLPGCRAVGRGCGAVGGAAGGLWGARWNGCLCADVVES